jgi:hypothetical protein
MLRTITVPVRMLIWATLAEIDTLLEPIATLGELPMVWQASLKRLYGQE